MTASEPRTAVDMFDTRLRDDPDAALVLTPDGAERSYRMIGEKAQAVGLALRERGVAPGDVVGLYFGNEPSWIVAVLATWWSGNTVAASGTVSPRAEAERRFRRAGARVVLIADDVEIGSEWSAIALSSEGDLVDPSTSGADNDRGFERVAPAPEDDAAIFFTSGTAGEPKGTVHTHERLASNARATAAAYAKHPEFRRRVASGERPPVVSFSPFGHLASLGRLIFRMYVGRSLLIVPRFDVAVLGELAARYPLDTLQMAPAMLHALAYTDEAVDLSAVKYVTSGTAPLPVSTRDAFEARYGVSVLQAYGSTEGGVTARERYDDVVAGRRGPGSVGRVDGPVRIVDPDGTDVKTGEDGEIIGRPDLSRSGRYLGDDGDDALPLDADGWYHTGDVGHLDEHGILYVTGRIKEMLVVGGFNVFPAEIEDVLRASPRVRDAVVVSVSDDRLGDLPVAALVLDESHTKERFDDIVTELVGATREQLAAYKVPRAWFPIEAVPLNANGKLDRQEAARLAAAAVESGLAQ